ncbi:MAG: hypothetical protein JWO81_1389, partial [Alphaproteobacteria bacterium]|nr:hypothetical protein [Alphaproteobacteria bacterium]
MDLSMYPPDVQRMMLMQMALSQASQPSTGGNPLLAGNDALRQQFAGQPQMTPWLDQREAHILGQDPAAPPPPAATVAPAAPQPVIASPPAP